MDDLRIEWLRSRVCDSLDVPHKDAFDELLSRDNGKAELMISEYLNETTDDTKRPLIFYTLVLEQDEEVEVECGMSAMLFRYSKVDQSVRVTKLRSHHRPNPIFVCFTQGRF